MVQQWLDDLDSYSDKPEEGAPASSVQGAALSKEAIEAMSSLEVRKLKVGIPTASSIL